MSLIQRAYPQFFSLGLFGDEDWLYRFLSPRFNQEGAEFVLCPRTLQGLGSPVRSSLGLRFSRKEDFTFPP